MIGLNGIFMEVMMQRMGFAEQWISLIMECTVIVSYRIKVNAELTNSFKPERGLWQVDSLSPYLFFLCAKGFSALFLKAERDGMIVRIKICQVALSISHLLFTDNLLILIHAMEGDAKQLQNILDLYEHCCGKMINKAKSVISLVEIQRGNRRVKSDLLQLQKKR